MKKNELKKLTKEVIMEQNIMRQRKKVALKKIKNELYILKSELRNVGINV